MKSSMPILWWTKSIFIVVAILFGLFYTVPTFLGNPAQWAKNEDGTYKGALHNFASNFLPSSRINLGLDLKGGLSLTLNVELNDAVKESISRSITRAKELLSQEGIKTGAFNISYDNSASIKIDDIALAC